MWRDDLSLINALLGFLLGRSKFQIDHLALMTS